VPYRSNECRIEVMSDIFVVRYCQNFKKPFIPYSYTALITPIQHSLRTPSYFPKKNITYGKSGCSNVRLFVSKKTLSPAINAKILRGYRF
jgi:hypothetical protein